MKIENFRDLLVWQEGNKLVISVYKSTSVFPPQEQFGLTNQLRRASVSITSNIAEGFARQGVKEKVQFYYMSLGSIAEVQNQLFIAYQINYLDQKTYEELSAQCDLVGKLLNGLIRSTKKR